MSSDTEKKLSGGSLRSLTSDTLDISKIPYARVLVVDDVLTNQAVAKAMLQKYGIAVDCVSSGQEAVSLVGSGESRYNAVFMDHMMPGMDGIEALRRIRAIDSDYARSLPVIVLTANVCADNENMFLAQGFQAFLSKPIGVSRLDEIIRRWVSNEDQGTNLIDRNLDVDDHVVPDLQNGQDWRENFAERSGIDRRKPNVRFAGMDISKGLERFGGNEETYLQVLHSYVVNTRLLLESIRHVSEDKLVEYAITVHGIKGSSQGIFADMIADFAEHLEHAAKVCNFAYISRNNPIFLDAAGKFVHDLEEMLSVKNTEKPKPKKDKPDREVLLKLAAACGKFDMDGADELIAELGSYQYESDDGLVDWLKITISKGYFDDIKDKLSFLADGEI